MQPVAVTPELVLTDEMYSIAHEAIRLYAPDRLERFTWPKFTRRESWVLVPDTERPDEPWYKAEFVIKNGPPYDQTVKLNVWRAADLRRDGAPMPHSHPWAFTGHVLTGGYEEDRYTLDSESRSRLIISPHSGWMVKGMKVASNIVHQAGDGNIIPQTTFHEVTKVFEPGRTMSLMDCSKGVKDGWGYLDPETGIYTPAKQAPIDHKFKAMLFDRNPHLRK